MSSRSALPPFIHDLMSSEQYSDLKIQCGGEELHVHRAIVCPQSEILSNKCEDLSEDAPDAVVPVEGHDVATVRFMIDFLYSGDYAISDQEPPQETEVNISTDAPKPTTAERVRPHICVYILAEEYQISDLKALATTRIGGAIELPWNPKGFAELVKEVFEKVDTPIRQKLAKAISEHIEDFCQEDVLKTFIQDELSRRVITAMKGRYEWIHPQLMVTQEGLASADEKVAKLEAEIERLQRKVSRIEAGIEQGHNLLHNTPHCRHCGKMFLAKLECRGAMENGYVLRCAQCRTKHK